MKILTIPFAVEGFGKGQGAINGPEQIILALNNFFASEKGIPFLKPTLLSVPVDLKNITATNEKITAVVLKEQPRIILGGDHSITYAAVKGFVKNNPDTGFVVFDAHPDVVNHFNPPTQEDYLITLIEEKILDPKRVILIGLRNWHEDEFAYLKKNKIVHFTANDIFMQGMQEIITGVMETVRSWKSCYVSIDIDVCDPSFAPGTGWQEPGGISSRELIFAVQRLAMLQQVKCFDIVEIDPSKDVNAMTVQLGAKLVVEIQR